MEGALDDSGPLQAADDECVGLGPFRLHQLALWPQPGRDGGRGRERPVCRGAEGRERPTVIAIYLYRHPNRHCRPIWKKNRCTLAQENNSDL